MDSARRSSGRPAAALAALAVLVTLGHLIGPHSHAQRLGHEFAHTAEILQERCDTDSSEGEGHDHGEVNCGSLVANAAFDAVRDCAPDRRSIAAPGAADGRALAELGPNGRAPPNRSALQVFRV